MVKMQRIGVTIGLCLAPLGLGCAALVDFPDDPQLVTQAALTANPAWQCLEQPAEPPVPAAPTVRVRARACDALRGCSVPVAGLSARVCSKIDVNCSSPLLEDLHEVGGVFEFDAPTTSSGFGGYLEISSAAEPCTSPVFGEAGPLVCAQAPQCNLEAPEAACDVPVYPRYLHFFNPPVTEDVLDPVVLNLLPTAGLLGILRATGGTFDASTGILIVTARDCNDTPAAGLSYELDQAQYPVTQVYMDNGVLSGSRGTTDATGIGGFVGVPSGYSNIEAYDGSGERVGGVGVQIAGASITNVTLTPSP
jgi:hypothetical protein